MYIDHFYDLSAHVLPIAVFNQWEFQDPKMEVLYHIRPYFVGIFPYIAPYIDLIIDGRYLQ